MYVAMVKNRLALDCGVVVESHKKLFEKAELSKQSETRTAELDARGTSRPTVLPTDRKRTFRSAAR
jgi:hypothetical protein